MSTVYVHEKVGAPCDSAPDRTSSRWRNFRFCRLAAKALRWAVARIASYWSPARRITVDETVYFISRTDDYISRELVHGGGYHTTRLEHAIRLLSAERRNGSGVLLNLGAHVGTALIPLLQAGEFAAGLAVEPAPENATLLERNLVANGLKPEVRVARVAIGDRVGQSTLHLSRTNSGNNTICENKLVWTPFQPTVEVGLTTIDRLLVDYSVNPKDVRFVVMDIQGYEAQAIAGGRSLFSLSPPLMMEMDHSYVDCRQKLNTLCRLLREHYRCFFDLDDTALTRHCVSSLEDHFATYTDYRDIILL